MIFLPPMVMATDEPVEIPITGPLPEDGQAFSEYYAETSGGADASTVQDGAPEPALSLVEIATAEMIDGLVGRLRGDKSTKDEAAKTEPTDDAAGGKEPAGDTAPADKADEVEKLAGDILIALASGENTSGDKPGTAASLLLWTMRQPPAAPGGDATPASDPARGLDNDRLAPAWWPELPGRGGDHRPSEAGPAVPAHVTDKMKPPAAIEAVPEGSPAPTAEADSPGAEPPQKEAPQTGPTRNEAPLRADRNGTPLAPFPHGAPADREPTDRALKQLERTDIRTVAPSHPPTTNRADLVRGTTSKREKRADAERADVREAVADPVFEERTTERSAGATGARTIDMAPRDISAAVTALPDAPSPAAIAGTIAEAAGAEPVAQPILEASARVGQLATPPTPAASTQSPAAAQTLHVQLSRAADGLKDGPIEVTLSPEELGRVRMTLVASDQGLTLNLVADRPETVELLRRNIGELAQDFRDLGFRNLAFSFAHGDQGPGQRAAEARPPAAEFDSPAIAPAAAELPPARLRATPGDGLDLRF